MAEAHTISQESTGAAEWIPEVYEGLS